MYSIPALFGVLGREHFECWRHFVLACRLLCKQSLSENEICLADALLMHFCKRVEHLYSKHSITPNMHMHAHLQEEILDFGPIHEFWLFYYERYNGILSSQPTNNRNIEPQLMSRFLKDNSAYSFRFPDEFSAYFFGLCLTEKMVGSVLDTMTIQKFKLPTKHVQGVLDADECEAVRKLYRKLYPLCSSFTVCSVFLKYSSVCLKGKTFGSSRMGSLKSRACVSMALWDDTLYGQQPTTLPSGSGVNYSYRPVQVHYYVKAMFSDTGDFPDHLLLARVSWFYPSQHRYVIGKPAELWCGNLFEGFGVHSYIPLESTNLICRCGYGQFKYQDEALLVVVPLVE